MKKTLSIFLRIDKVIEVIQIILITLGVFAMVVINGAQVFCRFVIRSSIPWSEQISVMVFFILIMLGGNLAMRTDTETRIEILQLKNARINKVIRIIAEIISSAALFVFWASSFSLEIKTIRLPQYLSSVHMSYVYIYIWLIAGFGIMIFDKIINILKNIICLSDKKRIS